MFLVAKGGMKLLENFNVKATQTKTKSKIVSKNEGKQKQVTFETSQVILIR